MANSFPVQTLPGTILSTQNSPVNISMRDIFETEGMPTLVSRKIRGFSTSSIGQTLINVSFGSNQVYTIGPAFQPYITKLTLRASKKISVDIRVDNVGTDIFSGPNDLIKPNGWLRPNTPVTLLPDQKTIIEHEIIKLGWSSVVNFTLSEYDVSDSTLLDFDVFMEVHAVTKQTDRFAEFVARFDGDSITNGAGSDHFENDRDREHFSLQINRNLKRMGYRFRPVNKGQGSMTSDGMVQALKWGYYDIQKTDLICIMIGANDANNLGTGGLSEVGNQNIFRSNIEYIINYNRAMSPNAKIMMFGSTPSSDNTTETRIEIGRQIMANVVSTLNMPNVKYASMATSFDRTNSANYLPSDVIHPTAQTSIANAMIAAIDATNWFPSKI